MMTFLSSNDLTNIRNDVDGLMQHTCNIYRYGTAVDSEGEPNVESLVSTDTSLNVFRFTNSINYNDFQEDPDAISDVRGYILNFPHGTDVEVDDRVVVGSSQYRIASCDESGLAVRKCIGKLVN